MNVIWTPEAEQDRAKIVAYIRADNPLAAARMERLFSRAARRLAEHPRFGRPGKIPGTRELIPQSLGGRGVELRNVADEPVQIIKGRCAPSEWQHYFGLLFCRAASIVARTRAIASS